MCATQISDSEDGGVCVTSYGMVSSTSGNPLSFSHAHKFEPQLHQFPNACFPLPRNPLPGMLDEVEWDYVICDEAHLIKNPSTKVAHGVRLLKSAHRVLLTGTPVQNSLTDLWALMDYATNARLLGALSAFKAT
jgi:SNF2 family DNA or RNA helicase